VRVLGLETATGIGSVALLVGDRLVERDFDPRGQGAVAALHHLLTEERVLPGEIEGFGVSIGPGSFTGIRIGVSVAQGFCRATSARAVPIGTLEGLAFAGRESDWGVPGMVLLP
jgi:tRNA threonylcarbamoyladenosine biosynthesis protein TsaB